MTAQTIEQIQALAAAERYAAAITAATGAQEKIDALTEAVKTAEWLRLQAESLVTSVTYPPGFPQMWHMASGEPPAEVEGLIDITSGMPYVRERDGLWRVLGVERAMSYSWPIEDAGPFIGLRDNYGLDALARTLDLVIKDHAEIRRAIYSLPGYREDDSVWSRPVLHEAVARVLLAMHARHVEESSEIDRLTREVERLQGEIAEVSQ